LTPDSTKNRPGGFPEPLKEKFTMIEIKNSDHTVYKLHSGATLALGHAPQTPEAAEPAEFIGKALAALSALEDAKTEAAADVNLSEAGRAAKVAAILDAAIEIAANASDSIDGFDELVVKDESETFRPPQLDRTDAVGALMDMEMRTFARGLDTSDTAALMHELQSNPALLEAILRSPLPLGSLTGHARAVYAQQVSTSPRAKEVQRARGGLDWAKSALPHIASHIAHGADRAKILGHLVASGKTSSAKVFGFTKADVEAAQRRAM
jgi:hypothetical protein